MCAAHSSTQITKDVSAQAIGKSTTSGENVMYEPQNSQRDQFQEGHDTLE